MPYCRTEDGMHRAADCVPRMLARIPESATGRLLLDVPCEGPVSAEPYSKVLHMWGGGSDIPFTREIKKLMHT